MCMRSTILLLSMISTAVVAQDSTVRFSVSDSTTMPLIDLQSGRPTDGILYHLYLRIAEKLGRTPELLVTPRMRTQPLLTEEHVDANCYMNPAWLTDDAERYRWSVPFMTLRTALITRADTPKVGLAQLKGERIGTVLGFQYPEAAAQFSKGYLHRDDARTENQVLEKLAAGRNRYAIATETALDWFNKDRPDCCHLQVVERLIEFPVHCIVRDEENGLADEILSALEQMGQDGEFEAIQARYR